MAVEPIRPADAAALKLELMPDAVIEAFNELIAENYQPALGRSVVKQDDVVALMVSKGLEREDIFDHNWLDIEELYGKYGWEVEYDKPGFNESYDATFEFTRFIDRR